MSKDESESKRETVASEAEKSTAAFFEDRRGKGDLEEFRRILSRRGGEAPREGDEL
jgi:hypothetical protein